MDDKGKRYICEVCKYSSKALHDYKMHTTTRKHMFNMAAIQCALSGKKPSTFTAACHQCDACGRSFVTRSGLWKHKQRCVDGGATNNATTSNTTSTANTVGTAGTAGTAGTTSTASTASTASIPADAMTVGTTIAAVAAAASEPIDNTQMMAILMQQMQNMERKIDNKMKKITSSITNTAQNMIINNTTNHFNLNLFLNEQCKDAKTLEDFIGEIEFGVDDLEYITKNDVNLCIAKNITRYMDELGMSRRPIHCTDQKRNVIYVKETDQWKKDVGLKKMQDAIARVNSAGFNTVYKLWNETYPNWESNPKLKDTYIRLFNNMNDFDDPKIQQRVLRVIQQHALIDKCGVKETASAADMLDFDTLSCSSGSSLF